MRIIAKILDSEWMGADNVSGIPAFYKLSEVESFEIYYGEHNERELYINMKSGKSHRLSGRSSKTIALYRMLSRTLAGCKFGKPKIKKTKCDIRKLPLSQRTFNGLRMLEPKTYEDLFALKKADFKNVRNFGDKSWRELKECIDELKKEIPCED